MIYLDNSATTPLCVGAREKIEEAMDRFGNPSSLHFAGNDGATLKNEARDVLYRALDARKDRFSLIFTSGGTEANNLAIFGAARAKRYKNPKILVSDSEHPSILEPCARLAEEGFKVVKISTRGGMLDEEEFLSEIDGNTVLVSVMTVNNETGAVYGESIKKLFESAHRINPKVICHTDAVQAFLKIPLSPRLTGADMITVSSHKVHGPKGCGALLVSREILKKKALLPVVCGGGQEEGYRSGTENTLGIAGFGGAVHENMKTFENDMKKVAELRTYLLCRLPKEVSVNLPAVPAPHILSITLPNIKSQTALNFFSGKKICVSSGSACSSNGGHRSYVLRAFGLDDFQADSTLRISLSKENTKEELDTFLEALREGINQLVRFKSV